MGSAESSPKTIIVEGNDEFKTPKEYAQVQEGVALTEEATKRILSDGSNVKSKETVRNEDSDWDTSAGVSSTGTTGTPNSSTSSSRRAVASRQEIDEIAAHYDSRLSELERRNVALHRSRRSDFVRAVEEVEAKFVKTTSSPICKIQQESLLECYSSNPDASLKCSAAANEYIRCVQRVRQVSRLADPFKQITTRKLTRDKFA